MLLGRWRLIQRLGEGAGGVTWRAEVVESGDVVALKIVTHAGPGAHRSADLLREAAVLQALRHPHVIRYLGVVDLPDPPLTILVMEFIEGGNLADWLDRRPPCSARLASALLLQVADALAFVHGAGVLHRDLKPANLLVRASGTEVPHLVVADFGICRPLVRGVATHTRPAGMPGYLPPEAWQGRELTTASDVYSLGALGWHLLTSQLPYLVPGQGLPDLRRLAEGLAEQRTAVDGPLPDLVLRMLALDPRARPSLQEIRETLRAATAGGPPAASPWAQTRDIDEMRPPEHPRLPERAPPAPVPRPTLFPQDAPDPGGGAPAPPTSRGRWLLALVALLGGGALICAGGAAWLLAPNDRGDEGVPTTSEADPPAPSTDGSPAEVAIGPVGTSSLPAVPPDPATAAVATEEPGATPERVVVAITPVRDRRAAPEAAPGAADPSGAGTITKLRVGIRGPVGLPSDAVLAITTAGADRVETRNSQATLSDVRAGGARVEVRTPSGPLGSAELNLPPGASVRVNCEALAADFSQISCEVR